MPTFIPKGGEWAGHIVIQDAVFRHLPMLQDYNAVIHKPIWIPINGVPSWKLWSGYGQREGTVSKLGQSFDISPIISSLGIFPRAFSSGAGMAETSIRFS
jgi:hypothetical protein